MDYEKSAWTDAWFTIGYGVAALTAIACMLDASLFDGAHIGSTLAETARTSPGFFFTLFGATGAVALALAHHSYELRKWSIRNANMTRRGSMS